MGTGIACLALPFFMRGGSGIIPPWLMGMLFGGAAGIMVDNRLAEVLPVSRA